MKIPPHFPHPTSFRHDRAVKRAMKDFPNGTGYGAIVILLEILASQPEMKYPLEDIDILADEIGISIPILQTIIEKYGIFSIIEADEKSFFSAHMNIWLEPYYRKIEENRLKGIKSGLARRKKIEKEIKELTLSQLDSTEPQFNRSSAAVEQIEENRREEKRKEENRKEEKINFLKFSGKKIMTKSGEKEIDMVQRNETTENLRVYFTDGTFSEVGNVEVLEKITGVEK